MTPSRAVHERRHLQLLLEKDPERPPLPTAGLPSYTSAISQHPSTTRRSTARPPATASTRRDAVDPNEHARHQRRHDDERAPVQPWSRGDDGTAKWTPVWTEEEHQALRAIRRGVDSLRPPAPLYSPASLHGEAGDGESGMKAIDMPQETVEELARHIGAFLRFFDAGLSFRGQGLKEQAIYIGGASPPYSPRPSRRPDVDVLAPQASAASTCRSTRRPSTRRAGARCSRSSSTSRAFGGAGPRTTTTRSSSPCPAASLTGEASTSTRSSLVRRRRRPPPSSSSPP